MDTKALSIFVLLFAFNLAATQRNGKLEVENCPSNMLTFELVTGYVLTSSADTLESKSGIVQLTDCLHECRSNQSCKAVNFETGLCVLLKSSASDKPDSFTPSHFPVFTIYAEKICSKGLDGKPCSSSWAFERVIGYELRNYEKKKLPNVGKLACFEACLTESGFNCRSVNYDNSTGDCSLSDIDRHALQSKPPRSNFTPSSTQSMDYYESNCVQDPKKMCDFKPVANKVLKTVDTVHLEVTTVEDCKAKCLASSYRCFSFDLGDPSNRVCRTSHLDRSSLTHIEDSYLEMEGSTTYELSTCYDVNILCKAKEMTVSVQTNKLFNGKIYAKSKPNSCVNDVTNELDFDIVMPFHDVMCDVKQQDQGKFSNNIIIQHHDMVVTTKDLGLSINCNYDLSNKSITNHQPITIDGTLIDTKQESDIHSQVVASPNITMKITDMNGEDIHTAQVGDSLILRFQITEESSPFQIFVRELVAVDGVDTSDIMLIDNIGCPTDGTIIQSVEKIEKDGKFYLQVPFEAFKFPTSDMVQFRAVVTPCLSQCEPVHCSAQSSSGKIQDKLSYGRRRRRAATDENELVMTQAIRITDSFGFKEKLNDDQLNELLDNEENLLDKAQKSQDSSFQFYGPNFVDRKYDECLNMTSMTIACVLFLLIQVFLIVVWAFCWFRRSKTTDDRTSFSGYQFSGMSSKSDASLQFNPTFMPQRLVMAP